MFLKQKSNRSFAGRSESGFALITIAIVLALIGILMIPAIRMYDISVQAERVSRNKTSSSLASSALNKFFLLHGHYPYPATPGDVSGSAAFGHAATKPGAGWPSCQNPITPDTAVCSTVLNTLSGGSVLIGVVPFAELNVPFSSVLDANKNLLTYAVTEDLTSSTTYTEGGGQIIVQGSTGAPIYAAGARSHFVVVGHGDDSKGAFGMNGKRNVACDTSSSTSEDFENCNKDGTFRSNIISGTVNVFINEGTGATHFDDYVQERNSSVSGIWSFLPNPGATNLSINDRIGGNVATGNCDGRVPCIPVSRLDIYGDGISTNIPAARATNVDTKRLCGRGNGSGDAPGTGSWGCLSDYTLATNGYYDDQTTCLYSWTNYTWSCPSGATWSDTNLPPWVTPQLIVGIPPTLPESGSYWITTNPEHGSFHRGNGIMCVGSRAMNGVFDRDEACNDTSYVSTGTQGLLKSCPTGQYARGLNADGSFYCLTTVGNM